MEDILVNLNDTRISKLFRPFPNQLQGNTTVYLTVNAATTSVVLANYSLAGTSFGEDTSTLKRTLLQHGKYNLH
jgi:hypothetical protein